MNSETLKAIYLNSEGRISRLPYFGYALAIGLVFFLIAFVAGAVLGAVGGYIALALDIPLAYCHYNLMAKRFHDLNQPSQYALFVIVGAVATGIVVMIPGLRIIGLFMELAVLAVGLYLLFMPGTAGDNDYGAPAGAGAAS